MRLETVWADIVNPSAAPARTAALRALLALRKSEDPPAVPGDVVDFLETYVTRETLDAALIGLILDSLGESAMTVPFAVAMRIFPILHDPFEPALIEMAVAALRLRTPEGLYRKAALLTADPNASAVDSHYAHRIVGTIALEDLKSDFASYLPAPATGSP